MGLLERLANLPEGRDGITNSGCVFSDGKKLGVLRRFAAASARWEELRVLLRSGDTT